jgi:hypothetical protein
MPAQGRRVVRELYRRECFDHVIILGEAHRKAVLVEYVAYFNSSRPHQDIGQRVPVSDGEAVSAEDGKVIALPVLNGLHHEYRRAA